MMCPPSFTQISICGKTVSLVRHFASLDRDHDGMLSENELQRAFDRLGVPHALSVKGVGQLAHAMDATQGRGLKRLVSWVDLLFVIEQVETMIM